MFRDFLKKSCGQSRYLLRMYRVSHFLVGSPPEPLYIGTLVKTDCFLLPLEFTTSRVTTFVAGNRNWLNGLYFNQGTDGYYWSSTPNTTNSYNANFNAGGGNIANNNNRGNGFSIRCLKN